MHDNTPFYQTSKNAANLTTESESKDSDDDQDGSDLRKSVTKFLEPAYDVKFPGDEQNLRKSTTIAK